jgi:cbb3-type cytochrome oxidase maturation protein
VFYLEWIFLVVSGVGASLLVFFWGLKTGQFSDQGRARYLPLSGEAPGAPLENPGKLSAEVFALLFVLGLGAAGMLAAVVLTLAHLKG